MGVKKGLYFQVYSDTGFEYLKRGPWTDYYAKRVGFQGKENPHLLDNPDISPTKILFVDDPEKIPLLKEQFVQDFPDLGAETSEPTYLEIMDKSASKGSALEWLGKTLQIPREKIAAFGDSGIDASMVAYAGLGVAVANACPEVLEVADVVAPSCDEDGVAWAMEKYILD